MDNDELEKEISDNVSDDSVDVDSKNQNIDEDLDNETFTYSIDNNNVNNDYNKNSYDDRKSFIYIIVGICILLFIIILLVFFVNKGGSKASSYSDIESKMISGAKKYYEKNSDLLPILDNSSVSVSTDVLIENSFLKPFSELLDNADSCSGHVTVFKSEDDYVYFPYLNCGSDYESLKLSDKIVSSGVVTSGDGLYKINDEYVYRGEYPNNYVKFDGKSWRIVKVNSDGSIKLIYTDKNIEKNVWDDRYNSSRESYAGINDFRVSRILDYLNDSYENNTYVSNSNKDLLVKHDWCIGKISQNDAPINSLNLCSDIYSDSYIGLLTVGEVLVPSIADNCVNLYDIECTNYNYFFNISSGWTLNASSDKSYIVFSSSGGSVSYKNASYNGNITPVININSNVLYKDGIGTQDDPYVIGD